MQEDLFHHLSLVLLVDLFHFQRIRDLAHHAANGRRIILVDRMTDTLQTEPTRLRRISYAVFCLKKKQTHAPGHILALRELPTTETDRGDLDVGLAQLACVNWRSLPAAVGLVCCASREREPAFHD